MRAKVLLLAGALAAAAPARAEVVANCAVSSAANPAHRKAFAATFLASADEAMVDNLLSCFADPDPAIRDEAAFTLWSEAVRGNHVSPALMRHAMRRLSTVLAGPGDAAGVYKPFAALALSEVARADRITAFLSDAELHSIAEAGATYLRGVADYRGFVPGEGWRHGVAHGADLLMRLALNPRLARADADLLLGAIAAQVAPTASPFYVHGEARRLARPVLFLAKRADIADAAWAAWFETLHPDGAPRWKAPYGGEAGLAAVHNSSAFADAVYVAASESQDPQVRRLAPFAAGLLKALP